MVKGTVGRRHRKQEKKNVRQTRRRPSSENKQTEEQIDALRARLEGLQHNIGQSGSLGATHQFRAAKETPDNT